MRNNRTIVFFRVNKAQPQRSIGDICDIVDGNKSIGAAIDFAEGDFAQVSVDLSEDLEEDLRTGVKKVVMPDESDPHYIDLLAGKITVTENQLLDYIEAN